jgi:hypothetical protein
LQLYIMAFVGDVAVGLPPPGGYTVDLDNPQVNMKTANYVAVGIGMTLGWMFLGQRLYVKAFIRHQIGIDDCRFVYGRLCVAALLTVAS